MKPNPKIESRHLERSAYVYIRQSSPHQVSENLESQDLQYQLAGRAQRLGWREDQIVIIDDDLGKSGVSAQGRKGFQALVAVVGLNQVGMILVTDVSRLARNCADWYQLLDLASHYGVLISDASGIYDPQLYDDRLLLGLKGTFSEIQWHQMRRQMSAARLNKAKRGELNMRLPVGLERQADDKVIQTPDQQVQGSLKLVFTQFERFGSVGKVMRYLRDQGVQLPRRVSNQIEWARPSYQVIYGILKQPAYAGAYTYGKLKRTRIPGKMGTVLTKKRPIGEWPVLIQDAYPAYISWEQYLRNQETLRQNAQGASWTRGAPRKGAALLQGIVTCGRCGRPMHIHYTHSPAYICDFETRSFGGPRCQNLTLAHIDPVIRQMVLDAVQPARLEAALTALDQLADERQSLTQHWLQRLERARYQADLARRRYEQVDPENRLVAAELEHLWEEKLQSLAQVERNWQDFQASQLRSLSEADQSAIRRLAEDLPALWQAESTTQEDRKRLLRCLICDVTLDSVSQPGFSQIHIRWHTGATASVTVPRPRGGTPPATRVIERLREMAQRHPDDRIAEILNQQNFPTATGLPWTKSRVYAVRRKHSIPTACPVQAASAQPRGDGLLKVKFAARRLGVHPSMISTWFRKGLIAGYQAKPGSPLWVSLTDDEFQRLNGQHPLTPDMIPLRQAAKTLCLLETAIRDTIRVGRFTPYRIFHNNYWHWYLKPAADTPNPFSSDP